MCKQPDLSGQKKKHLGMEIRCTEHMIKRRVCQLEGEHGAKELPGGQGVVLGYILHSGKSDVFQKDIEKTFNIRRSTATVMLKKMEQAGLISRTAVKSDARLKKIEVTPAGYALAKNLENRIALMEEEISKGISEEEKELFLNVLHKINRNLGGTARPEKE